MDFQKREPEKSYGQSRYHIDKVLFFIVVYKIMATNLFFTIYNCCYWYITITPLCFVSNNIFLKEKVYVLTL